ncbi:kinesin-like nuclear fusion protein [Verticillium nonalfalfae]|uniref:Kinesin-like protein n=1 Tax=Verticillium nonalfalfae TaxID=1051616 RepID=A0A3M9Y8A1_9PEZI|nr:kinesin-like nuclear fusion protein [Verticillium nonalfalfae]RNJ56709.1 kinesin-like nuclear fusion protein [Verticillium nonalfalfae]
MDTATCDTTAFRTSTTMQRSQLPRPGAPPHGLSELSESQSNARPHAATMMPPPSKIGGIAAGTKREVPQPAATQPQRRTLMDRARDYPDKDPAAPSAGVRKIPPRANGHVKGQSLTSLKQPSSGLSSRQTSTSTAPAGSRQTSSSSFASSMGAGRHALDRSKSALGNRDQYGRPRGNTTISRPQTSHGHNPEDDLDGGHGQNAPTPAQREVSLNRRFKNLSIDDDSFESAVVEASQVVSIKRVPSHAPLVQPLVQPLSHENITIRSPRKPVPKVALPERKPKASRPNLGALTCPPVTPAAESKQIKAHMDRLEETVRSLTGDARSPIKSPSPQKLPFLSKFSNTTDFTALDVHERLGAVDTQMKQLRDLMDNSLSEKKAADDAHELMRRRVTDLETERERLGTRNETLQTDLETTREKLKMLQFDVEAERRNHKYELEDEARRHRNEQDELRKKLGEETERLQKTHREALEALDRQHRVELEDERSAQSREVQELRSKLGSEQQDLHLALQKKEREMAEMRAQVDAVRGDLDRAEALNKGLASNMSELAASNVTLEAKINSLKSHVEFLESDNQAQSDSFANMEAKLQEALLAADEARHKLIKEETERRILFNKYQELKGNIRVMCRVRPVLGEGEGEGAKITFPDDRTSAEIALQGAEETTAMGRVSRKTFNFEFDRVFAPAALNQDVFDEISQLVQSALDGYNVCIFCYGQTGSGKTHTMSSEDGMIPRATHMIYDTITKLKAKSWTYTMEGSFIEVYNEELNDLLAPTSRESDGRGRRLEIRHDEARKQTTVAHCKTVALDSADKVEAMLAQAQSNRSVAATKSNERSSRSHSVFILKLVGHNASTGERCEGTLNLVDLAGSERLKQSGAEGERMKETQSINKSLSCLGDVIEALGRGSGHVPYRNSKLTHLLQYSLGGNSKTLMFVMVSPLETHLKETLTSLRFATKVHNTHIGTAKATKKG